MKSTFGSVTQPAIAPIASDQPCLKKGQVDPSPTKLALDSIIGAFVPFQLLSSPPLASHTAMESILDFRPPSSTTVNVCHQSLVHYGGLLLAVSFMSLRRLPMSTFLIPLPTALPQSQMGVLQVLTWGLWLLTTLMQRQPQGLMLLWEILQMASATNDLFPSNSYTMLHVLHVLVYLVS